MLRKRSTTPLASITLWLLSCPQLLCLGSEPPAFNAGLRILAFSHPSDKRSAAMTVALWYPTHQRPKTYIYPGLKAYASAVAVNAPVSAERGPYPLILFAHGGYGYGFGSAFFLEYLARHGYIAVAPDYTDTRGPDYTEPLAFCRINKGATARPARVLRAAAQFVADMEADRDLLLAYMAKYRLKPTSFVLDKMLELNRDKTSFLYQSIAEGQIGICGYSLGGLTAIGSIGAHPGAALKDARIKAGLIFSGAVYPFEDTVHQIAVPIMVMRGDKDPANLGRALGVDRKVLFDQAPPPKYYLVLKDGFHFSFTNRVCGDGAVRLDQATQSNLQARAICEYGLAFLERYVRGNRAGGERLEDTAQAWVYYRKEEAPGVIREWGDEPAAMQGVAGGIGGDFGKRIRERIRKRRGKRGRLGGN